LNLRQVNPYAAAVEAAWAALLEWHGDGRFTPHSEEDVQCLLYCGIVTRLGTAAHVLAKPTSGKPDKLTWDDSGKLNVGNMHFPDLLLGPDGCPHQTAVEIKFKRTTRANIFAGCRVDLQKLEKYYSSCTKFFVLFDAHPEHVFLDEHQLKDLQDLSGSCRILYAPTTFNPSLLKAVARRNVQTQRAAGANFVERGKAGAKKAMFRKA
jgi:hypothetical protein